MLPDFVIIGAQKAGSTSLMSQLGARPDVFVPRRETRFFRDPWYRFQTTDDLAAELAPAPAGTRRWGIKSPDLLGLPDAPQRVLDTLGPVDLVAILRDPVARFVSAYFFYTGLGILPVRPLAEGVRLALAGRLEARNGRGDELLGFGRYGEHLQRWIATFGRQRLFVLTDDDLRHRRAESVASTLTFLGVDDSGSDTTPERTLNEGVYSLPRLRFLQQRRRFVVRGYPGYDGEFWQGPATLVDRVADRAILGVDRYLLARVLGNEKPTLTPEDRQRLQDHYRDDIALTERLLDRDLSAWLR